MHAASLLFSWNMELLAFANRLFSARMLVNVLTTSVCHCNLFLLASERSSPNHPLREAPCRLTFFFFSERARLQLPWPLTASHLNTASFNYLLGLFPAFLWFVLFFCGYFFSSSSFLFLFILCCSVFVYTSSQLPATSIGVVSKYGWYPTL